MTNVITDIVKLLKEIFEYGGVVIYKDPFNPGDDN